jgi:hypothetical protein
MLKCGSADKVEFWLVRICLDFTKNNYILNCEQILINKKTYIRSYFVWTNYYSILISFSLKLNLVCSNIKTSSKKSKSFLINSAEKHIVILVYQKIVIFLLVFPYICQGRNYVLSNKIV